MKRSHHAFLVLVLAFALAAPAAFAAPEAPAPCPKPSSADGVDLTSLDQVFQEETLLATPADTARRSGGRLGVSEKAGGTECEWYWIDCGSDGTIDEWCCGNLNSCLGFCVDTCQTACYPA